MSLARHTAFNLAGQALPLALSLLTVPHYLQLIGEARFGVLALIWLFFGYLGLFDLGMGQATAQLLSRSASSDRPAEGHGKILFTAFLASLGLGLVGAAVAGPIASWFFNDRASLGAALSAELSAALPWAVTLVPLTTVSGVLMADLQARRAFGELNLFGGATNALVILAPLAVAATTPATLRDLVAAVVCARLCIALILIWRSALASDISSHRTGFDWATARGLLRFGGWATISAGIGPLMVAMDRFLIGTQMGAKSVSHYVIPFQLAERATTISAALNYALFPRLVACASEGERLRMSLDAARVLIVSVAPLVAVGILLSEPFLAWWISPSLAVHSTGIAQILLLAFWINSLAMVPYSTLLARGRSDLVAKSHAAELLPYLLLLYVFIERWGLVGVATVFAIRVAFDLLLLAYLANMAAPLLRLLTFPATTIALLLVVALAPALSHPVKLTTELGLCAIVIAWSWSQSRSVFPRLRRKKRMGPHVK